MKYATSPTVLLLAFWLRGQWVVAPAAALDGDVSKKGFDTYGGWSSFEVVTQGDKFGEYRIPGQFDGIGVSCFYLGHMAPYHPDPLVSSDTCHITSCNAFFSIIGLCHQ